MIGIVVHSRRHRRTCLPSIFGNRSSSKTKVEPRAPKSPERLVAGRGWVNVISGRLQRDTENIGRRLVIVDQQNAEPLPFLSKGAALFLISGRRSWDETVIRVVEACGSCYAATPALSNTLPTIV